MQSHTHTTTNTHITHSHTHTHLHHTHTLAHTNPPTPVILCTWSNVPQHSHCAESEKTSTTRWGVQHKNYPFIQLSLVHIYHLAGRQGQATTQSNNLNLVKVKMFEITGGHFGQWGRQAMSMMSGNTAVSHPVLLWLRIHLWEQSLPPE